MRKSKKYEDIQVGDLAYFKKVEDFPDNEGIRLITIGKGYPVVKKWKDQSLTAYLTITKNSGNEQGYFIERFEFDDSDAETEQKELEKVFGTFI